MSRKAQRSRVWRIDRSLFATGLPILLLSFIPLKSTTDNLPISVIQQETEDQEIIIETALRHLISEHGSDWLDRVDFFLLCIDSSRVEPSTRFGIQRAGERRDITEAMSERLNDLPLPIKKLSECTFLSIIEHSPGGIIENGSQKHGIMYSVGEVIRWIDKSKIQVYGQYYYNGRAAAGWILDLEKKEGLWTVTKMDLIWVS